jgi:membrane protease YdiL (CAAX protease family)
VKARQRATFFGLFVALILPFLLDLAIGKRTSDLASQTRVIVAIAEEWGLVALLLGVILLWERQALATIGIKRMSGRDVAAGILGFLLGALSFVLTTPLIGFLGLETTSTGISKLAQVPVALRVAVVLTAGITEEILFRGYPIERITALTGKLSWGATIAYVVFVLLHIPFWGLGGTIQIGVWTLIVTVLYARRRNLLACMLMHILNDAYAFVLLPLLLPQYVL